MTRILIVDDEDAARLTLLRILQLEGFDADGVENGQMALESLARLRYDLLILDLKMPGMSGMEVLSKAAQKYPYLKVIILTAHGSFDSAVMALRLRVVDYLLKPVSPEIILASVRRSQIYTRDNGDSPPLAEIKGKYAISTEPAPGENTILRLSSGVEIDLMRRQILWSGGAVHLTPNETKALGMLLSNHALVMRHQEIVQFVYGYRLGVEESARMLRPMFSRLNHKLAKVPGGEYWIRNIRGSGYVLEIEGRESAVLG